MGTALVAGGAGFIGSHVCDRLLAEGHAVLCLDSLITGRQVNIAPLMNNPRFRFVEADVRNLTPGEKVDEIWNLASPASPPHYQRDPIATLMTNVVGTEALLAWAQRDGARFFQASTSEVYGDPAVHPQPETYWGNVNSTGPRACYDEGKRAAEALCFDYRRTFGTDVRVARIFNTYGPRMDPKDGRVVSNFLISAFRSEPLDIYGDGSQTRSFCYVDDLVEGFFRMMRAPSPPDGPVNFGNPGEFTIRELAGIVLELTGSRSGLAVKPLPADDPRQRRPDITRAGALYGWSPAVPLREGLTRSLAYFEAAARAS